MKLDLILWAALLGTSPRAQDVRSVFFVAKSENRNEVHYAVRVDEACAPVGDEPVFPYWVLGEEGGREEDLLPLEHQAYGLGAQRVAERTGSGGAVDLTLRALPTQRVRVQTWRGPGGCEGHASTEVPGAWVELVRVYVEIGWLGIGAISLEGLDQNGATVRIRIDR
jgi:hypothetical protein